jgi:hypothetical protein
LTHSSSLLESFNLACGALSFGHKRFSVSSLVDFAFIHVIFDNAWQLEKSFNLKRSQSQSQNANTTDFPRNNSFRISP